MSIYKSNDETIPTDTEAYYEVVASQEETYLEEVEEELPVILIFGQDLLCNTKIRGTKETRRRSARSVAEVCALEELDERTIADALIEEAHSTWTSSRLLGHLIVRRM